MVLAGTRSAGYLIISASQDTANKRIKFSDLHKIKTNLMILSTKLEASPQEPCFQVLFQKKI